MYTMLNIPYHQHVIPSIYIYMLHSDTLNKTVDNENKNMFVPGILSLSTSLKPSVNSFFNNSKLFKKLIGQFYALCNCSLYSLQSFVNTRKACFIVFTSAISAAIDFF